MILFKFERGHVPNAASATFAADYEKKKRSNSVLAFYYLKVKSTELRNSQIHARSTGS